MSRQSILVDTLASMANAEFSTVVETDALVVVDRTMWWDSTAYGTHAETAIDAPATTWYLAEGATHSGFNLFYLVQNPTSTPADLQVTYLLPAPASPITRTYSVPANSRFNIWVNKQGAALASTDVSAVLTTTNGVPVIVERAMYLDSGGLAFGAGHESAGIRTPATEWYLAEGATGAYFDLFVLIANPGADDAAVQARYLLPNGTTITKNLHRGCEEPLQYLGGPPGSGAGRHCGVDAHRQHQRRAADRGARDVVAGSAGLDPGRKRTTVRARR